MLRPLRHILQKRHHIVGLLRSTKPDDQNRVIRRLDPALFALAHRDLPLPGKSFRAHSPKAGSQHRPSATTLIVLGVRPLLSRARLRSLTARPPVARHRYRPPHLPDPFQINLRHRHARPVRRHRQHMPPRAHDHGMPKRLPQSRVVMPPLLRRRQHIRLTLDRSRPQQRLPVVPPRRQRERRRHAQHLRPLAAPAADTGFQTAGRNRPTGPASPAASDATTASLPGAT